MKRAFLIHGWEGYPEEGWRPWLKKELEKKGFSVLVPAMPDTVHPRMDVWVPYLAKTVGKPDKDCYFVGHSLGCITILRYLETIDEKIGGAVFVAGFGESLGINELESFFRKPVDWKKIRSSCRKFVAIHSDDDPYVPMKHGRMIEEKLDAKLVVERGMKHFSGDNGVYELPAALDAVLEISR